VIVEILIVRVVMSKITYAFCMNCVDDVYFRMRGISSEAMVMCASSPEKVEILDPPPGCMVGERVVCAGYEGEWAINRDGGGLMLMYISSGEPDGQLNPKKKVFENVQPDFRTNDECVACYKGVPFTVPGKGVCRSQTMKGTGIK